MLKILTEMNNMKNTKLVITLLLLLGCSLSLITGCSGSKPADVLVRFQKATNNRDLKALLDCYDPNVKKMLTSIGGMMSGGSMDDESYDAIVELIGAGIVNQIVQNQLASQEGLCCTE